MWSILCFACLLSAIAVVAITPLWTAADCRVARFVCHCVESFNQEKWHGSQRDRRLVLILFTVGLTLVVLVPFEHLWTICPNCDISNRTLLGLTFVLPPHGSLNNPSVQATRVELWEVAVCFWTILYLAAFVLFELRTTVSQVAGSNTAYGVALVALTVFGFLTYYFLEAFVSRPIHTATERLRAELVLVVVLCAVDYAFFVFFARHASVARYAFIRFLIFVDGPALLAFLVALLYSVTMINDAGSVDARAFAAGVGAFSLVVVNTVFTVVSIREKYIAKGTYAERLATISGALRDKVITKKRHDELKEEIDNDAKRC